MMEEKISSSRRVLPSYTTFAVVENSNLHSWRSSCPARNSNSEDGSIAEVVSVLRGIWLMALRLILAGVT